MDNSKRKQSSGWASNVEERVTVQRDVGVAEIRRLDLMCQNFNSSRVLQDSSIGLHGSYPHRGNQLPAQIV